MSFSFTNQVLAQLNSGRTWSAGTISYAFPTNPGGLFSQGEGTGFRAVNASQQALMTTTDLNVFAPAFVEGAKLWRIEAGRLVPWFGALAMAKAP